MQPNQDQTAEHGDTKASLGLSNMLRENLFKHLNPGNPDANQAAPVVENQSQDNTQNQADPRIEAVITKMDQMEQLHVAEIEVLRSQISEGKMKSEFDTKLADLEQKHIEEIDAIKAEVKTILNG